MAKNTALLTKTGKQRIKGFNVPQLTSLLDKTTKPKDKNKIQNRINVLTSRG